MAEMASAAPRPLLRDQERATIAYQCVAGTSTLPDDARRAYKGLVLSVGVDIRRLGLSGALAVLERDRHGRVLLEHLARAPMRRRPLANQEPAAWVRELDLTTYMVVTRELLLFVVWLRRAAQALVKDGQDA